MAAYYLSPVMVKLRKRPIASNRHPSWLIIPCIEKKILEKHIFKKIIKNVSEDLKIDLYTTYNRN